MFRVNLKYVQCYCNVFKRNKSTEKAIPISYFMKIFDMSYNHVFKIMERFPDLHQADKQDVENSFKTLLGLNYTNSCIGQRPEILRNSQLTLENRFNTLKECGCTNIDIHTLTKYVTVMNKSVTLLKSHRIIPFDTNVVETLLKSITDIELNFREVSGEISSLNLIRMKILNIYLKKKLGMKDSEIAKMWKIYGRIKHICFASIIRTIDLLQNELNFTNERIIKNTFTLYGDPDNILRYIRDVKNIGDMDIREILRARPKLLMGNCESTVKSIDIIRKNGIPENSINRCLEVLTLSPITIEERLKELKEVKEFDVLISHPRVLRLVHYHNKAVTRLEYLKQLKVKCASLHILSSHSDAFEKYARDGSDKTRGSDITNFLQVKLKVKNRDDVRYKISRHPNWCHVPIITIKGSFDFLESKKFSLESMFENVHILLYPVQQIESKLNRLETEDFEDFYFTHLTQSQVLGLCLYYIELEYHFTGDGIWAETGPVQHTDSFTTVLPEMPKSLSKLYKYGVKPAQIRI